MFEKMCVAMVCVVALARSITFATDEVPRNSDPAAQSKTESRSPTERDPATLSSRKSNQQFDYPAIERRLAILFPNSSVHLKRSQGQFHVHGFAVDEEERKRIMSHVRFEIRNVLAAVNPDVQIELKSSVRDHMTIPTVQVMLDLKAVQLRRSRQINIPPLKLLQLFTGSPINERRPVVLGIFESPEATKVIEFLTQTGNSQTLAAPRLVVVSGHPASFELQRDRIIQVDSSFPVIRSRPISEFQLQRDQISSVNSVGSPQERASLGTMTIVPTVSDNHLIRLAVSFGGQTIRTRHGKPTARLASSTLPITKVQLRERQSVLYWLPAKNLSQFDKDDLDGELPITAILVTPQIVRQRPPDEIEHRQHQPMPLAQVTPPKPATSKSEPWTRVRHLRSAVESLTRAGHPELARQILQKIDATDQTERRRSRSKRRQPRGTTKPMQVPPAMREMIHGVSGLRLEVQQLRRDVQQLQKLIRQQNSIPPPRPLNNVDPNATQSRSRQSTIDRTIALKSARFKQLMKDKDFELAEAVAREAARIAPGDSAVQTMLWNARFARQGIHTKFSKVINVPPSHNQHLDTKKNMRRISLGDPKIIDIAQPSPSELIITALKSGSTTITVWFEGESEPVVYLVNIPLIRDVKDFNKTASELPNAISRSQKSREFALKLARFNQLLKDKNFELAEAVAHEVARSNPDSSAVPMMLGNLRLAREGVQTRISEVISCFPSHSSSLVTKKAARRIAIADPTIADVIQFSPTELGINARKAGSTTLRVWLEGKSEPVIYLLNVVPIRDGKDNVKKTANEIRIERELDKAISLQFKDTPLKDALQAIGKNSNINIVMNVSRLEEEGITAKTPINIEVRDVSLRSALKIMLQPLKLVAMIEDEVLKITSKSHAKGPFVVATYPVAEILSNPAADDRFEDLDDLVKLIQSQVQPDSWSVFGGAGRVHAIKRTESLVIRQTDDAHEEVRQLLLDLRKLIEEQKKGGKRPTTEGK